ncbi:MAG: protein translocase subunit SecD [Gammaproteobacteria bacterium]|nr:MAG: protein translocase subunit SecD [Gammaproteobacteria bacterium]
MNHYPIWKSTLIAIAIVFGLIFASPNLFPEQPALQLKALQPTAAIDAQSDAIRTALQASGIPYAGFRADKDRVIIRFDSNENQAKAKAYFDKHYNDRFYDAMTITPATPDWMQSIGLKPITKGLDLRGGVYLLLQVDTSFLISRLGEANLQDIQSAMDDAKIDAKALTVVDNGSVKVTLQNADDLTSLENLLYKKRPDLTRVVDPNDSTVLTALVTEAELNRRKAIAVEQNTTTLRSRMNSIGVAEPSITRQGMDRIVVQLPGLSDPNDAISLIQSTASLEYYMVDEEAQASGKRKFGVKFINDENGRPVALKRKMIISGENIIDASSGLDNQSSQNIVSVVLDEAGAAKMGENTHENVGKPMAVVYIEFKPVQKVAENGETVTEMVKEEKVISVATINGQFSKRFQTTGNFTPKEARDLARSLRSGALVAPVYVIEERTVGPSAGKQNIEQGKNAIALGFVLVMIFMLIYYRKFGIVAVTALLLNVVFIIALLSFIGATLTLPGIAGVVLTMGMAVDANVLIFERIREELRTGKPPREAIKLGFDNAFSTITDANITTLIAAAILFSFGTGPIKGFAVTLSIGILTSMFTAIMVSRFIIHYWIERRRPKTLSI